MPTTSSSPTFKVAVRSDVGLVRENNEDSAFVRGDCLIIADGMGGHSSGEIASAIAVHTFAALPALSKDDLLGGAERTREVLRHLSKADETLKTMGTTVVALCEHEGTYTVCHIGDSRMYRLRGGSFTQITTDHTHVQHLVETGRITREEIPTHPYRAMLLKSLDDQPGGAAPDSIPVDLKPGDRVLLCSDGLSDYASEHAITQALLALDLDEAADALLEAAFRAHSRDNVTIIVADLVHHTSTEAEFAGAAADPVVLSPAARAALAEVDPGGSIPLDPVAEPAPDPLTRTQVLPAPGPEPAEHTSFGRPGIYAAMTVAVLAGIIGLLL